MKVLIVENEKPIATQFSKLLLRMFKDIQLLAVCEGVEEAIASIQQHRPDLVFLDVELNKGETGFDILRQLSTINFEIIFVSAYDKYAVQAIKYSALDYLLKPVTEEDLAAAIERFQQKKKVFDPKQLEVLFANIGQASKMNQVALPTINGLDFVSLDTIIYCEGESSQTAVYVSNKNLPIIISKTLKESEELFSNSHFFRIHKSYLINMNHLKKYIKGKDGQVLMSNDKTLEVSRNYKDNFLERLKNQ
jgi:two-component system, LytTR family, response regulator